MFKAIKQLRMKKVIIMIMCLLITSITRGQSSIPRLNRNNIPGLSQRYKDTLQSKLNLTPLQIQRMDTLEQSFLRKRADISPELPMQMRKMAIKAQEDWREEQLKIILTPQQLVRCKVVLENRRRRIEAKRKELETQQINN